MYFKTSQSISLFILIMMIFPYKKLFYFYCDEATNFYIMTSEFCDMFRMTSLTQMLFLILSFNWVILWF